MPRYQPTRSDSLAANLGAARAILAGLTEHQIYTSDDPADALIAEYWEDTLP